MHHEQAAQLALRLFHRGNRFVVLALGLGDPVGYRGYLPLGSHARLLLDEIRFFMGRGFHLIGGTLREQQRILQRLFHGFEVTDPLAQIGDF